MNRKESSSMKGYEQLIQQARKQAKTAGIKPSDITKAITTVRRGESRGK